MNKIRSILAISGAIAICFGVLSANAQSYTSFRWFNAGTTLTDDEGTVIPTGDATIITYLSTDSTIDFDAGVPLQETYGNGFFHAALQNNAEGFTWTTFMTESSAAYLNHYAYAIVLDMPFATYSALADVTEVPLGTYFGMSQIGGPILDRYNPDGPDLTQQTFNPGSIQTSMQVVPEPSVFALMGLGGLLVMIRRRFVVKS